MGKQKTDLQIKKDEIRKKILEKRNNLSIEEVDKKSELIIKNLSPYLKNAQNIMIFMDMKNEVKITKLLEFYPKKNFFISKIVNSKNREMKINKYNENELILHKFGYYESSSNDFYDEKILDIVIVPALAFDFKKNRIGFGGGYYDTFLNKVRKQNKKALFIGVCYDFQMIEEVPIEGHDITLDFIINESEIIWFLNKLKKIFSWNYKKKMIIYIIKINKISYNIPKKIYSFLSNTILMGFGYILIRTTTQI